MQLVRLMCFNEPIDAITEVWRVSFQTLWEWNRRRQGTVHSALVKAVRCTYEAYRGHIDDLHAVLYELSEKLRWATDLSLRTLQECEKASDEPVSASTYLANLLGEDVGQAREDEWYVTASRRLYAGCREALGMGRSIIDGGFNFVFKMPAELLDDEVLLNASASFDDAPATHLSFVVGIGGHGVEASKADRRDVSSAFLSYASKDRGRVAVIAQGIEAVRPDLDVFLDVENLRSGDDWQWVLDNEIRQRDVLFLCWSRAASGSEWVYYEWRCAYGYKGIDGIEPVAIDPPSAWLARGAW